MLINITDIATKTNEQIVNICHKSTAIPSLIIAYFSAILILGLCGVFVNSESKKTFTKIWFTFSIFFVIVIVALIYLPNSLVQPIAGFFSKIFAS